MTDLPKGWRLTTLGQIGRYLNGRGFRKSEWRETGRPIIRIQNLTGSSTAFNYFDGEPEERYTATAGDLLVSWAATLGSYIWAGPEAVVNQHIFKVESFIDTKFHKYLLDQKLAELARQAHGSGMVHITRGRFDSLQVMVPTDIEEQRCIVAVLEGHLSRLDAATDYATAAARRAARLSSAVLRGQRSLGEAPSVPLREVLAGGLSNGRSVPTLIGGFPVLRLTALGQRRVQLEQRKGGAWSLAEARPFLIERGDYLVSRGNGSLKLVGRGAPVVDEPDPVAYPDTLIRVRVDPTRLNLAYLHLIWNSAGVRQQIEAMARTTAGIYKVNQTHLESTLLPLPSLQDQRRVVDSVSQVADAAERLSAEALAVVGDAQRLRRALLAAAFSGRLSGGSSDLDLAEEGAQGEGATQAASVVHP